MSSTSSSQQRSTQSAQLKKKEQFWPVFVKDIGNLVMILVLILCREAAAGEDEAQQLTIFYGGKVVLFDKFPPARVKDLLQIVNAGGDGGDRAGDTKGDAAGGGDKGAFHGMSAVEAKDSQTIVALQSPVTVMRPVRGDLEEHVPKPCENQKLLFSNVTEGMYP